MSEKNDTAPGSALQWYDLGVFLRKNARFGEAINAFQKAADMALEELSADGGTGNEAAETVRSRALASIELIREINGFVNTDLMNP